MKEVIQKLFLAGMLLSILAAGCASTSSTFKTDQNVGVRESIAADVSIHFPEYYLSISKPPPEWEVQEDAAEGELAIWVNREAGSVIEIMVSRFAGNMSYHNIATEFNRVTCAIVQQRSPAVICDIIEEKVVDLGENRFYQVAIVYRGLFQGSSVKSTVYLYRVDDFVYHFLFMEEKDSQLVNRMMSSVVFHENKLKNEMSGKRAAPASLIDACYEGDIESVEMFLAAGVDINAKDREGVSALSYASDRGHLDIVRKLLAHDADVNAKSDIGSTPLMNASYMGHVAIVRILVASGADVNAQSNGGTTALMNATAQGYKEIVEILLAHDADVNECENCGLTALWNAISSGYDDIVKLLINDGAEVNARADDGATPLMNAAFTGNIKVVKMLLAADAKVNAKADNGLTALKIAKRKGHREIVRLLIKAGAMEDPENVPHLISMSY